MSPIDYTVENLTNGGARRDRTDDLLNANQALFQPIVSSYERDGSEEQWCSSKPILCDPERVHPISKLVIKIRSTYLSAKDKLAP